MVCNMYKNMIICYTDKRRKFRYKKKYYYVEKINYSRVIFDNDDNCIFPEDYKKRKRHKFYKEIIRGI